MIVKTRAIVINSIKYQDKSLIVKCLTLSDGVKSYFIRDAFSNSKKSNKKTAYFQPLSLLEVEAKHNNKSALNHFLSIKPIVYQSITSDMVKSSLAIFLSEILNAALKEEDKNEDLYLFLETALLWLDEQDKIANFHLITLLELTKFLGFYPRISNERFFELTEGVFSDFQTKTSLSQDDSELVKLLLNLRLHSSENPFNNSQRRRLLEILIEFYSYHIDNFKKPNSLEIFREVFS